MPRNFLSNAYYLGIGLLVLVLLMILWPKTGIEVQPASASVTINGTKVALNPTAVVVQPTQVRGVIYQTATPNSVPPPVVVAVTESPTLVPLVIVIEHGATPIPRGYIGVDEQLEMQQTAGVYTPVPTINTIGYPTAEGFVMDPGDNITRGSNGLFYCSSSMPNGKRLTSGPVFEADARELCRRIRAGEWSEMDPPEDLWAHGVG